MSNPQQPELRRNGKNPATSQRPDDPNPVQPPHGTHDTTAGRPVPKGQQSPYGPGGKAADDDA